ncbi:MAG: alkaline phosphatase family protein [Rhizobiales bacterium]|nr:alkaline phosphatase family protein [Hyphomicrobiales bacterium]NRB15372.1 alkaline phosphatase family protein [Hyphomicrobiales bacterium]
MQKPKKILFIIMDQLRADCVFGALAEHIDMPNLTALMADATCFKRHYSVVNPCGPARASILTGQYAMNHRSIRNGTPLAHNTPNLAREMRKAGYDPMLFGYTDTSLDPREHHPNDPDIRHYEQVLPGFNEKLEMRFESSFPWRAALKSRGYKLPAYADFFTPATPDGQAAKLNDPAFYRAEDSDTAFLTDYALNELSVRRDEDWFAHITYIRPHPPLVAPAPYNQMYQDADFPPPKRLENVADEADVHPFHKYYLQAYKSHPIIKGPMAGFDKEQDDEAIHIARSVYFGLITELDHHIGRIINQLKQSGEFDETLIVIKADHGEMLGDHHMWGKQCAYDAAYHVPLIIRDPYQPQMHGKSVEMFTESIDVTPTILDWVGQTAPVAMDGHSLMPFLSGETPKGWRQHVFAELDYGDPRTAEYTEQTFGIGLRETNLCFIRTQDYKLVHFNGRLPALLFDVANDPDEMTNLAANPEYAETLLAMTQKLLNHRMTNTNHALSDMLLTKQGTINYTP